MSKTPRTYPRFELARRIEHLIMLLSFGTLGITGLPQKYPSSGISHFIVNLFGGIEGTRSIHHIAATVMMVGTIYHLLVFGYKFYVKRTRLGMLPALQDVRDGLQATLYNLGFAKKRPQMGRYTFEEKLEYWAFVWGTVIMGLTGFMMWNPITTSGILPGEFIPAAKAAHGLEAVLAVLAILIWHFYGVHFKIFNKAMWTGSMTEEEMLHEHPLELADIKAGVADRPVDPIILKKRQRVYFPVAAILTTIMLAGVFGFVNSENTAITTLPVSVERAGIGYDPQTPTPFPTLAPTPTPQPMEAVADLTWSGYIGPVLQEKCSMCHGALGGLSLASYADAMTGGQSGAIILPGDGANSLLVTIQIPGDHLGQLTPDELSLVQEWIDAGAPE
ncbi:MAG: hypothetical protein HN855_01165 [Anaerolineae bacterium]|jgi:cytochrome b subunit of formate dehydrogenase|nr:hypothetical protein [Anaerolineae bacterium]MBT7071045.1 hypothetical protein [Anaerolineae bacterium]MBT7323751.1 hypothetical protein [Anaerolineae bacterium]